MAEETPTRVRLGGSGVSVPNVAVGTWQWGDRGRWGFGTGFGPSEVVDAFLGALEGRLRLFDTAEVYGHGVSERSLGWMAARVDDPVVLATKFAPLPGRGGAGAVGQALRASLARLRRGRVDLYQAHWADRTQCDIEVLMEAMGREVHAGRVGLLGVSNFSAAEMARADDALRGMGLALATQQVRYNLVDRGPERDGVLALCRARGCTLLAYSPLAQGILTGKYDPDTRPPGPRGDDPLFGSRAWPRVREVLAAMREVAAAQGDRSIAQVAINWLRAKDGVLPIVGVKTGPQAREAAGALTWSLTAREVATLDAASDYFAK